MKEREKGKPPGGRGDSEGGPLAPLFPLLRFSDCTKFPFTPLSLGLCDLRSKEDNLPCPWQPFWEWFWSCSPCRRSACEHDSVWGRLHRMGSPNLPALITSSLSPLNLLTDLSKCRRTPLLECLVPVFWELGFGV